MESWYLSPQWTQSSKISRGLLRRSPGIGIPQPSDVNPVTLNDILDKQHIYLVVDVPLSHRVPNLLALNDFKCLLVLQWLHYTQFIGVLAFVARHLHTAHVVEQHVNNWLMKTSVCKIIGNDLLGSSLMPGGYEKVVLNYQHTS